MPNISSNRTPLNRNQPSTDRLRPAAGAASSSSAKDPLWVGGLRAKDSRNVFTLLTKACLRGVVQGFSQWRSGSRRGRHGLALI